MSRNFNALQICNLIKISVTQTNKPKITKPFIKIQINVDLNEKEN